MEAFNNFDRRGLLDLPITFPSIPLLNPLLNGGGPKPNPTVTPPPQQDSPKPLPTPAPTPTPGTRNDNNPQDGGGGGGGGDNTPPSSNSGGGNTGAQDPNTSPNSPTPTSNPNFPDPNLSNPPNPSPTSGSSPSQSSGKPQGSPAYLSGPNTQDSNHSDSPGDSGGPGNVVFTTISGVRTEITQAPHPHPGTGNPGSSSTGGSGGSSTNGGGGGSGGGANHSTGGGLSPGVIAAIVIGVALALVLLVLFLRKRVGKQRAAQHRRWLSGRRDTLRSSFGDLRASGFGFPSGHDDTNKNRYSGPFSDTMAAPLPSLASPTSSTPQMTQVTHTDITLPAIAVHSTGKRSSRNSQFSIGSAGSGETDGSEGQWLQMPPKGGYGDNGELSPTDQHYLPSPISVRPFSPSESWSFPKPPKPRPKTFSHTGESKGFSSIDPFADPIPQPSPAVMPPAEVVTRTFEPMAADELVVEIGDEVSMLKVFDDGWAIVKVLSRNGRPESVQGLEGLIPIDCLRPKGYEKPLLVDTDLQYTRRISI